MAASLAKKRELALWVASKLREYYPGEEKTKCALRFRNPYELLVATILAARCTDEKVNQITPALFERYPTPKHIAEADQSELEEMIRPTGFFRNKAKALIGCCEALVERFDGEVPRTMEELVSLPGVGRKTANVVLTNSFGLPGIVVDTHVLRLAKRLGLSDKKTADEVEQDLMKLLPKEEWSDFCHRLTYLGRETCQARKPDCGRCPLRGRCPSAAG